MKVVLRRSLLMFAGLMVVCVPSLAAPIASQDSTFAQAAAACTAFDDWLIHFQTSSRPASPLQISTGHDLVNQRRTALRALIRHDPRHALELTTKFSTDRQKLPMELPAPLTARLETRVSGYASINPVMDGEPPMTHAVVINGRIFMARLEGGPRKTGRRLVPIQGIAVDADLAIANADDGTDPGAPANDLAVGFEPASAWTHGQKSLLFIIVQYADQPTPPTTPATASGVLSQVAAFYRDQSYGQVRLTNTITEPILLTLTSADYTTTGTGKLYNDAVDAARTRGYDADLFDLVMIRHAGGPGAVGSAVVGQKGAWVMVDDVGVISHELGHNFGLNHANSWWSSTAEPYGPGSALEYGDLLDRMGPNRGPLNSAERAALNWLPRWAQASATNGLYRLYPIDAVGLETNRTYALRVLRDSREYWIECQSGPLAQAPLNRLQIRWPPWSQSRGGTTLIDTTPGSPGQFNDAPLRLGHTFSDKAGIHITAVRPSPISGAWLEVAVQLGDSPGNRPPNASLSATSIHVLPGQPVGFSVSASDPDSDSLAYGWEVQTTAASGLNPEFVAGNTPAVNYSWTIPGIYEVRCAVSDMKGGRVIATISVTVGTPSSFTLSGRVTDPNGTPIVGAFVYALPVGIAITDPAAVAVPNYRTSLSDQNGNYRLGNLPAGQYQAGVWPTLEHKFVRANSTDPIVLGPSATAVNFSRLEKGPRAVRGFVRDGVRVVPAAIVRLAGQTTLTDTNGAFAFSTVPPGIHTLSAERGDDQFMALTDPVYIDAVDETNSTIARVLYQLSGRIHGITALVVISTTEPGRAALAAPVPGDISKPWTYTLNVPRGLWHLEANLQGMATFRTVGFSNPVLVVGTERPAFHPQGFQTTTMTNLDFEGWLSTTYAVRGRITASSVPQAGVRVNVGGKSVVTDSIGNYVVSGLANGSYSITATNRGFTFSPPDRQVTISSGNLNGLNFEATLSPIEQWRAAHFSPLERLLIGVSADDADPDLDGTINLVEYALDLDPRFRDITGLPFASIEGDRLVLTYTRPATSSDILYRIEAADELGSSWNASVSLVEPPTGSPLRVRWRRDAPVSATTRGFLRLRVERP